MTPRFLALGSRSSPGEMPCPADVGYRRRWETPLDTRNGHGHFKADSEGMTRGGTRAGQVLVFPLSNLGVALTGAW